MIRRSVLGAAMLACLSLASVPVGAQVQCDSLSMTVTATFPNDPGFEGLWKYTLTGSWDLGLGAPALSHINIAPGLGACDCICEEGLIVFDAPAGTWCENFGGHCVDFDFPPLAKWVTVEGEPGRRLQLKMECIFCQEVRIGYLPKRGSYSLDEYVVDELVDEWMRKQPLVPDPHGSIGASRD